MTWHLSLRYSRKAETRPQSRARKMKPHVNTQTSDLPLLKGEHVCVCVSVSVRERHCPL